ncbi:4'-phosphopantetheinyl transferase family protein [Georgenia ruanii]|uniref:4'-phosphopantetheinyl transferase superfamily protein n=1 Tax=Georgenia ruanii TaxID=348442 RepID=A0A7J9UX47_9MICO|nr:4'-phosphopantetheinyl transferase superfamily protein [Georgenia ruanii]MPV89052.1 4'-phosphopantetheinyl transferase superfamily protein [Georgenia ruanii]
MRSAVDVWLLEPPQRVPDPAGLDDAERERAARLPVPQAARFVAARRQLRAAVAERLGLGPAEVPLVATCAVCGGPHGRVRVDLAGAPSVSVTRSGPLLAVAVGGPDPLGVDVESAAAVAAAPLDDVALAPAELAHLRGLADPARAPFRLRTWVRKEATLKALGTGLDLAPADLELAVPGRAPRLLRPAGPPGPTALAVGLRDLVLGTGRAGAVAVLGAGAPTVRQHDGAALLTARS